jgi:hypothetical protein
MKLMDCLKETAQFPQEGDVGYEEYKKYGRYFTKGTKVRENRAGSKVLTVLKHVGPQVTMTDGTRYHPTKLKLAAGDE